MHVNWTALLDMAQWFCLLALFASRSVVKRRLDDLQSSLCGTEKLVQDMWHESLNAKLNDCCFCAQPWAWHEREQLDGGAWVHRRVKSSRMVFCHQQTRCEPASPAETSPESATDEPN